MGGGGLPFNKNFIGGGDTLSPHLPLNSSMELPTESFFEGKLHTAALYCPRNIGTKNGCLVLVHRQQKTNNLNVHCHEEHVNIIFYLTFTDKRSVYQ